MVDVARLAIEINSNDAIKATSNLNRLAKQGKVTERATDGMTSSFMGMNKQLVAIGASYLSLQAIKGATTSFIKLSK